MLDPLVDLLQGVDVTRCVLWRDPPSGLTAVLVIDDVTLGPAVGGTRTRPYPTLREAVEDAARLARAMTIKNALGNLNAGGAKLVVMDDPHMHREAAFEALGERIEELGGLFGTAGDLGTTSHDLRAMARRTRHVNTDTMGLERSVARGLLRCVEACAAQRGLSPSVVGLRIGVQGTGAVGAAVARALSTAGAKLVLSDIDANRARVLAEEIGAQVLAPEEILTADVDVVAPCAVGGILTAEVAREVRAWAVCGAANRILASAAAEDILRERHILHVPDVISSAGAVIEGVARVRMQTADPSPLIDKLGETARLVLSEASRTGRAATEVAEDMAWTRIAAARRQKEDDRGA